MSSKNIFVGHSLSHYSLSGRVLELTTDNLHMSLISRFCYIQTLDVLVSNSQKDSLSASVLDLFSRVFLSCLLHLTKNSWYAWFPSAQKGSDPVKGFFYVPFLAILSASSFPCTPMWAGKWYYTSLLFRFWRQVNICIMYATAVYADNLLGFIYNWRYNRHGVLISVACIMLTSINRFQSMPI